MNSLSKKLLQTYVQYAKPGMALFGHGVCEEVKDDFVESLHEPIAQFAAVIELMQELGFEFIDRDTLIAIAGNQFRYPKLWIHLSFDDGYKNNFTVAYPWLKARNIPFTLFISTHHIDQQERFYTYLIRVAVLHTTKEVKWKDLELKQPAKREKRIAFYSLLMNSFKKMGKDEAFRFMDYIRSLLPENEWEKWNAYFESDGLLTTAQLQQMVADPLVTIDSHAHHHLILNKNITKSEVAYEMQASYKWILQQLQHPPLTFCYPNGTPTDYSPLTKSCCQQQGYQLAFTTLSDTVKSTTDPYEIPRVYISTRLLSLPFLVKTLLIPKNWIRLVKKLIGKKG